MPGPVNSGCAQRTALLAHQLQALPGEIISGKRCSPFESASCDSVKMTRWNESALNRCDSIEATASMSRAPSSGVIRLPRIVPTNPAPHWASNPAPCDLTAS